MRISSRLHGRMLPRLAVCAVCFALGFGVAAAVRRGAEGHGSPVATTEPARPSPAAPKKLDLRRLARAEEHFQTGYRALKSGRYPDALEAFEKAAVEDPTDPRPHHGLGQVYRKMLMVERAEKSFRRAIQLDPRPEEAQKELVKLLYERGEFGEATEILKRLGAKNPGDSFVWAELAINAIGLDRPREAIELLTRYNEAEGRQAWGYANLARANEAAGDLEAAEKSYREALAIDPRFTQAYHGLGRVLAATDREDESRKYLQRYRQLRELETAGHQLQMALFRDPDDVDTLMRLAQVRFNLGKAAEALELIERARRLRPTDRRIEEIYRKVRDTAGRGAE